MSESLERWHLKKEISFGNLLTSIIGITAIVVWIFALQNRVSITETRLDAIVATDKHITQEIISMGNSVMTKAMGESLMSELKTIGQRQYDHLIDHNTIDHNTSPED